MRAYYRPALAQDTPRARVGRERLQSQVLHFLIARSNAFRQSSLAWSGMTLSLRVAVGGLFFLIFQVDHCVKELINFTS